MKRIFKLGSAIVLLTSLTSCMLVGPNYERPALALPESYGQAGQGIESSTLDEIPDQWWKL